MEKLTLGLGLDEVPIKKPPVVKDAEDKKSTKVNER